MKKQTVPQTNENEILRRMLNTPPVPHKNTPSSEQKTTKAKSKS